MVAECDLLQHENLYNVLLLKRSDCKSLACSSALTPAAAVMSGETIVVETATQHAGDDYDKVLIPSLLADIPKRAVR